MSAILCKIAATNNPYTKTDARRLIRIARQGGEQLPPGNQNQLAEELWKQAQVIRAVRSKRRQPAPQPPTFRERVAQRTRSAAYAVVCHMYRRSQTRWAGGDHDTYVEIGTPSARGTSERAWSDNGKWSGTNTTHRFTVPLTWIPRVQKRNLCVCDDMFTLDAEPIVGHGPELFRAVWVEQGRGFDLHAVHGYIARIGTVTYHARTARAALDGVARKVGEKPPRRKGTLDLDRLARRYGDLPVYFSDSLAVGNCEPGTRSWCNAVDIDWRGPATVAEVVRGYKLRPLPGVISVLRLVVRQRHNRQPLDRYHISGLEGGGTVKFDAEGGFTIE